ncbi:MAG TPA: transposase [Blastocatellia bacterium]|nr:transposase [Blastocatellia bacterium]
MTPKQEFNEQRKPMAYFISFRCYGTWLHGDVRGSVDRTHKTYGSPFVAPDEQREYEEFRRLKHAPVILDERRRPVVEKTVREVCEHRNWLLRAINVRTNHVHTVVTADRDPEPVMDTFKAYATRRMTEAGLWRRGLKPWSRHGSTRWLWTTRGVERAIDYVLNCQGDELPNFEEWDNDDD